MSNANHTLTDEQFATVCANLLHQCLIEPSRTVVKRVFRDLQAGKKVFLTKLRMEDDSLLRVDLTLDSTAFIGILNFSTFRGVVQELLIQFRERSLGRAALPVAQLPSRWMGTCLCGCARIPTGH